MKKTRTVCNEMQHPEFRVSNKVLLNTQPILQAKLNSRKVDLFNRSTVSKLVCKPKCLLKGYQSIFHFSLLEP